jgi:hypothetical protein
LLFFTNAKGSGTVLGDTVLKQAEEEHKKQIEVEKMEKDKYQREIEEMKLKLAGLSTEHSSPQVKLNIL